MLDETDTTDACNQTHVSHTSTQNTLFHANVKLNLGEFLNEFLCRETDTEIPATESESIPNSFLNDVNSMWSGLKWPSLNYQLISEFVNTMALSESSTQQLLVMVSILNNLIGFFNLLGLVKTIQQI